MAIVDWHYYLGELDLDAIYDLGNEWIKFGDSLYNGQFKLNDSVAEFRWSGAAGRAASDTWGDHMSVVMNNAADAAWKIGEAINAYGDNIKSIAQQRAEHDTQAFLANLIGAIIGALLPFAFKGLTALFPALAGLMAGMAKVIDQIATRFGAMAAAAAEFAAGAVVGSVTTFGIDMTSTGLASAITGQPFSVDWGQEGMNVGIGAGLGGTLGAGFGQIDRENRFNGVSVPATGGSNVTPETPGNGKTGDFSGSGSGKSVTGGPPPITPRTQGLAPEKSAPGSSGGKNLADGQALPVNGAPKGSGSGETFTAGRSAPDNPPPTETKASGNGSGGRQGTDIPAPVSQPPVSEKTSSGGSGSGSSETLGSGSGRAAAVNGAPPVEVKASGGSGGSGGRGGGDSVSSDAAKQSGSGSRTLKTPGETPVKTDGDVPPVAPPSSDHATSSPALAESRQGVQPGVRPARAAGDPPPGVPPRSADPGGSNSGEGHGSGTGPKEPGKEVGSTGTKQNRFAVPPDRESTSSGPATAGRSGGKSAAGSGDGSAFKGPGNRLGGEIGSPSGARPGETWGWVRYKSGEDGAAVAGPAKAWPQGKVVELKDLPADRDGNGGSSSAKGSGPAFTGPGHRLGQGSNDRPGLKSDESWAELNEKRLGRFEADGSVPGPAKAWPRGRTAGLKDLPADSEKGAPASGGKGSGFEGSGHRLGGGGGSPSGARPGETWGWVRYKRGEDGAAVVGPAKAWPRGKVVELKDLPADADGDGGSSSAKGSGFEGSGHRLGGGGGSPSGARPGETWGWVRYKRGEDGAAVAGPAKAWPRGRMAGLKDLPADSEKSVPASGGKGSGFEGSGHRLGGGGGSPSGARPGETWGWVRYKRGEDGAAIVGPAKAWLRGKVTEFKDLPAGSDNGGRPYSVFNAKRANDDPGFKGPGTRLGRDGTSERAAPGGNKTWAELDDARLKRAEDGTAAVRPVKPQKPATTRQFKDLASESGTGGGSSESGRGTTANRNGNGSSTMLEQPKSKSQPKPQSSPSEEPKAGTQESKSQESEPRSAGREPAKQGHSKQPAPKTDSAPKKTSPSRVQVRVGESFERADRILDSLAGPRGAFEAPRDYAGFRVEVARVIREEGAEKANAYVKGELTEKAASAPARVVDRSAQVRVGESFERADRILDSLAGPRGAFEAPRDYAGFRVEVARVIREEGAEKANAYVKEELTEKTSPPRAPEASAERSGSPQVTSGRETDGFGPPRSGRVTTSPGTRPQLQSGFGTRQRTAGSESTHVWPPTDEKPLVVAGWVLPSDGVIAIPGLPRPMNPAELAAWIRGRPGYSPGTPVVLLAPDARSFASALARRLGADVTGPWGHFVPRSSGELAAGRLETGPDGEPRFVAESYDRWHTYTPRGEVFDRGEVLPGGSDITTAGRAASGTSEHPSASWWWTVRPKETDEAPEGRVTGAPKKAAPSDADPASTQNEPRPVTGGRERSGTRTSIDQSSTSEPRRPVAPAEPREPARRTDARRPEGERSPRDVDDQVSPRPGSDRLVVVGKVLPADGTIVVPGRLRGMTPAAFVAWVKSRPEYESGVPLLLVAKDARSFAPAVASLLGVPVTAPWGAVTPLPSGHLLAATPESDPDGALRLANEWYDAFHTYEPDGQVTELGQILPTTRPLPLDEMAAAVEAGDPMVVWRAPAVAEQPESGSHLAPADREPGPPARNTRSRGDASSGAATQTIPVPGRASDEPTRTAVDGRSVPVPGGRMSGATVAARLVEMPPAERGPELEFMTPAMRRSFAVDREFVGVLADAGLSGREFASIAAPLLIEIPRGVEQPVSARRGLEAILTRMLVNPEVAKNVLLSGAQVWVIPRNESLTSLPPWHARAGTDDGLRGISIRNSGMTAVSEENLLGEERSIGDGPGHDEGYSSVTHEIAHLIYNVGLTDAQRQQITDWYGRKLRLSQQGSDTIWPDGRYQDTNRPGETNYSATNEREFFAQLVNVYLGTNTGFDPATYLHRNNGPAYVEQHEGPLAGLLQSIFDGPEPVTNANPVGETRAGNEFYSGYRSFWAAIERTGEDYVTAATSLWQTIRAGLGRTFSGATPDGADTGRSRPSGSTTVPTPSRSAAETSAAGHDRAMSDLSATEEAERLAALPADERLQALRALPEERRDALALDPEFFQRIRALLPTGFADVAAALMIQIPEGVEQPATARYRLQSILATMLGDPDVAGRLLSRQVRVVVIPKSQALTSLAPWRDLAGKSFNNRHDMTWDDVRGAGATSDRPVTAVAEENLVGEANVVGGTGSAHPPGYSTVVHEIAHSIHLLGLSEEDQRTILRSWQAKWEAERAGGPVAWPDGLLRTSGDVNHSATDDREYFAQAVNTYLGVNKGFDGNTKSRRNNGLKWIQEHEKSLLPILQRTFGNKPAISIPVNPVGGPEAVIEGAVQDFWRSVETSSAPAPARKRAAPEAPGTRKRPSLGSGSGLGQVIDLGNGVRANGLYRALAGEPRPRTAADYQTFLSDSVDGRRPLSFVVNIILPAGEVGRIPEVIDAVMTGYDGPPGRVAFVFGVNQQGVPGAGLPARVSNQINRILGSLTYPAAVVGSVFAREFRPGTMRNEVLSSSATRALVEGFVAAGTHPYISVQDFDQGARTVPSGKHVFQHFDDKLQVAGGVDRPVMMAGGYRVSPDMEAKPGLRDAVLEDMRTRDQLAAIHPLLPYAPEPNLFFDGTLLSVEGTEIRFGDGGAEFGRLAETLNTAYAAELSLAHSTDEDGREAARVDGANNRHPLRGQAYVVDFVEGATATDLSRFNERFTGSRGSLPQSHSTLESVRTQFYLSRTASSGTSLGRYRAGLRTRYLNPDADRAHDPLRRTSSDLQETSSGRQRWRPLHRSDQRDIAAGGRLNRRISMDLTIPPGPDDETGTPAAGVQADEAVLAAHLVAGSDPMTKLIYQMSFLGDEILTHGMPPPVAGNTLFDAVARFVGRSADSVRTGAVHAMRDELGIEAEDRGMAQPAVMQGVRSPFGYGDLINAFVQHTLVRHTEEHSENQRADSARDLAGRAIATHLGQTLVIHLPDGDTVRLEPFRDASGGTVEVDLHTIGDRQTFLPHGVRASRASASRRAIDHDGDTEMPDASQQSSFSFPPGPPVAAPWKTMWPESRRGSRTQTIFASLPPVAEDVSPPQATTAEQTYESDDSQVDPLDTTRPLDPDLLEPPADSFAESAEPAEPAEPEESTEPVEPQESTAPHESTEPVQSTEPVEPEESTKPAALDTSATAARPRYAAPAALRTFFSTKIKSLHRRFAAAGTSSAPAVPATRNGAGNGSTPSRPVLKMPQGIGDFVANTMDAIDATVPPVPRGPHLRAGRLPSIRPDQGFELTPERLADEFGMPRANQTRFRQFADRFNLVLDVRPTNPASRRWLEDGALPKPHTIKSKTINELDVHLGASGDQIGLVGFFRPRLPSADDLASMPEQQRRQVEARYEQRRRESVDLAAEMTKYTQSGEFRIRDGVIEGIGADGEFRPLTGDHDLYNIRLLDDGAPLSKDAYEEVIWLLTHRNMGVQHGAHMYWRPDGAFQEQIFNEIVSKHQMGAAGAEPLIRFSPGEEPSLVFADETATTSMSSEPAPEQVEPPPARRVRWADQTGETTGETTAETTGEQDDSGTAPPPEPMKLADVLDQAQVYVLDDRPVLLRLPGAPADLPAPDPRTVEQLGSMAPPQTVFVIAEIRDGDVVIGDQVVTPAVLGAVLGARAPGYQPFLLSPGSSPVAERLTTVTDGPVLSAPSGVDYDPDRATMTPRADTKGKGKAKASDTASFRLHLPDEPAAAPLDLVLAGEPVREPPSEEPPPKPTTSPAPAGTTPKDVDEMVRSIGVPRAGLPYVPALIRAVQEELAAQGVTVTDDQMVFFVKQLLARYQYLLGDSADDENTSGLMVPIGGAEVLVTFDPSDPHTVDNPAGSTTAPSTLPPAEGEHEGFETVNAGYATGAHVETHSGSTERTPGGLSAMFGYGVAPGVLNVVKAGASIKGVANQSSRSTTHVMDAEGGHVEDNRIEHTLVAYRPNISVKIRTGGSGKTPPGWEKIKPIRIADPGTERLLLWLANSYLAEPAARQVTAAGEGVKRTRLAPHFSASGLTRLPKLFDEIVHTLESQGLKLKLGGATRGELWQKLLNLGVHLGKAVNDKDGYELTLHDEHGRTVAIVQVYSARLPDGVRQVGATSEKRHIEDVRTLIDGGSSGHNLTNTSSVTPLAVEFGLLPLPDAAPDVGLAASVGLTYTETNVDSLSAGRVGLWVQVPRFSGQAGAYKMTFAHQAKVWVRGAKKSPDAKTVTTPVVGRALVSVPEPQAFEHGLPVDGEALKTLPEGDTVPYDPEAIRGGGQRGTETGKDKGKGKAVEEPASEPIPPHILKGKGIGTGLLRTDEATVEEIRRMLKEELRPYGFLPEEDRPFGEHRHTHGNKVESRLDNKELLDKMVSLQSLDTNYDQAHQDGLTFTLRLRRGAAGMDLDTDSAKVTIRAKSREDTPPEYLGTVETFHLVNLAMGMDTAGQGTSHSRKIALSLKFKGLFKYLKAALTGIEAQRISGASDSAAFLNNRPELADRVGKALKLRLTDDYEVTVEYQHSGEIGKIAKDHRDRVLPPIERQTAVAHVPTLGNHTHPTLKPSEMSVAELINTERNTPSDVLDQAIIYYADLAGLREAAAGMLKDLVGPAGAADRDVSSFAGHTLVRSHLKEIFNREYTTDRPFEPGLIRNTFGALDISGSLGPARFVDATSDPFVIGIIKLLLLESRLTATKSSGITWDQLDLELGSVAGQANLSTEWDVNRHWQRNTSKSSGRTGAKELIQLKIDRAYLFEAPADLKVSGLLEKRAKLLPSSTAKPGPKTLENRPVGFLLSEPDALHEYARRTVPLSDTQLTDVMKRWQSGELIMNGDVAAGVLTRWRTDVAGRPKARPEDLAFIDALGRDLARAHELGGIRILDQDGRRRFGEAFGQGLSDPPALDPYLGTPLDLVQYAQGTARLDDTRLAEAMTAWQAGTLLLPGDVVAGILLRWTPQAPVDRDELAATLASRHGQGTAPVRDEDLRRRLQETFGRKLPQPPIPAGEVEIPEYLTREDRGGRFIGANGIESFKHRNGKSTYQIVKERIDKVAPGMLSAGAELWNRDRRVIGRMQGGVDALQSLLAKGRDDAMLDEFLAEDGYTFYLVNPTGWLLSDIVEVTISSDLFSPEIGHFVPNTGTEIYGYGGSGTSMGRSRDGGQALTFAKLNMGGLQKPASGGGNTSLKIAEGHHRGTTRSETHLKEQTKYAGYDGQYIVGFDTETSMRVRRLDMSHRPLNNRLLHTFDRWTKHSATSSVTVPGRLEVQVGRALAESGRARGPHPPPDLRPLPKLPGNSFNTGVVFGDTQRIARKMLERMFEPGLVDRLLSPTATHAKTGEPHTRPVLSLPLLFSRMHLGNHLADAAGGGTYWLPDGIFEPGQSRKRADIGLKGDFYGLEVLGTMKKGSGVGRYNKYQSGTTVSASTDHSRVVGDFGLSGSGAIGDHTPGHSWSTDNGAGRSTAFGDSTGASVNKRDEQHGKEKGPLQLVRMRFRGTLVAKRFNDHLFRKNKPTGHFESDPITGEAYAELYQEQIDDLNRQLHENARAPRRDWPAMERAPRLDLAPLLTDTGGARVDALRAYRGVAQRIRRQAGANTPVVLTADQAALTVSAHEQVLRWAVRTMRDDLEAIRRVTPDFEAPEALARYELRLHALGVEGAEAALGPVESLPDETTTVINTVNALHSQRPDNPTGAPASAPREAAALSLDPAFLGRDVAHELNAHVQVDIVGLDGTVRRTWADPDGRAFTFDPARIRRDASGALWIFDPVTSKNRFFTAEIAQRDGLLQPDMRAELDAYGFGYAELGRLYLLAQERQQTFEQAAGAELAIRRDRLTAHHDDLPELLQHAADAQAHWRQEAIERRRLQAENDSLTGFLELSEKRHQAEWNEEAATKILDLLRAAARSGFRTDLTEQEVREIADGLDRMTFQHDRELAMSRREQRHARAERRELAAWAPQDRGGSSAASRTGGGLTREQESALTSQGLAPLYVPATGDEIVNALGAGAATELAAIGRGRPATPDELRRHLADMLAADLARTSAERRLWPMIDAELGRIGLSRDAPMTDDLRRSLMAMLTSPGRSDGAEVLMLVATGVVLRLRVVVISPSGVADEYGFPSGRRIVLVRLPQGGAYIGVWTATRQVGDGAPSEDPPSPAPSPGPQSTGSRQPIANLGVDPFSGVGI